MEETHESGFSRFCNSLVTAFCLAPLLICGMVVLLGWNEKRAVCELRAVFEGKETVQRIGCDDRNQGNGELVMFECDLSQQGLQPVQFPGSDFTFNYVGPIQVHAEMLQCIETGRSETTKDALGGGTTTKTSYTYSVEWRSMRIDSNTFKGKSLPGSQWAQVCGIENPQWPAGMPPPGSHNAKTPIMAGPYTLGADLHTRVALSASVAPQSWGAWSGSGNTYTHNPKNLHDIGHTRVSFKGFDWVEPTVTVLGQNNGGTIGEWTASDSWLCSGFPLLGLEMGSTPTDTFFLHMQHESETVTYILRFVGFFLLWCAFKCFCGPLGVVADCVPCVGPYLGNMIETVACFVSCPPACACLLGVVGIVWVAMRPAVGIPLLIIFCCTMSGFVGYEVYKKQKKKDVGGTAGEVAV